jgi:hypothetical protein
VLDNTGGGPNAATGITLNKTNVDVETGEEVTLTSIVEPRNNSAVDRTVTWVSLNPAVATVSGNNNSATITTKIPGVAVITATTHNGITAACQVNVGDPPPSFVPVQAISLTPAKWDLKPGNGLTMVVNYIPANTTERDVVWGVDYTSVVRLVDGVFIAQAPGVATITATSVNEANNANIKATCVITVTQSTDFNIKFDQFTPGKDVKPAVSGELILERTRTTPLTLTLDNATDYEEIFWKVNVPGITGTDGAGTFSLEASQFDAFGVGSYFITLEVKKGGLWYSTRVTLVLEE